MEDGLVGHAAVGDQPAASGDAGGVVAGAPQLGRIARLVQAPAADRDQDRMFQPPRAIDQGFEFFGQRRAFAGREIGHQQLDAGVGGCLASAKQACVGGRIERFGQHVRPDLEAEAAPSLDFGSLQR